MSDQTRFLPDRINYSVVAFRWVIWSMPSWVAFASALLIDRFKIPVSLESLLASVLTLLLGIGWFDTVLAGHHRNEPQQIVFGVLKFTCMQLFIMPLLATPVWMILDRSGVLRL